jgi:hypothetical protein
VFALLALLASFASFASFCESVSSFLPPESLAASCDAIVRALVAEIFGTIVRSRTGNSSNIAVSFVMSSATGFGFCSLTPPEPSPPSPPRFSTPPTRSPSRGSSMPSWFSAASIRGATFASCLSSTSSDFARSRSAITVGASSIIVWVTLPTAPERRAASPSLEAAARSSSSRRTCLPTSIRSRASPTRSFTRGSTSWTSRRAFSRTLSGSKSFKGASRRAPHVPS